MHYKKPALAVALALIFTLTHCSSLFSQSPTIRLFEMGHADEHLGGFFYFEPVTLAHQRIIHSYVSNERHSGSSELLGDVKIRTYNTDGTFLEEESSDLDSLFISKTILKANGEKIILGDVLGHLALYDTDTQNTALPFDALRSFVLHVDASNQTLHYSAFAHVQDIALDEANNTLYFTEQFDFDSARVYAYNLNSGQKNVIATINKSRVHARILKTEDYIYVAGASIAFEVEINGHSETTNLPYITFVIQLNTDGSYNWIKMIRDETTPHMGLAPAPDQGVYFCSDLLVPVQVGNDSLHGPTWGGDFLLTRIDSSGAFLWATEAPDNTLCGFSLGKGFCLGSDGDYNVYLAGSSRKILEWDNGLEIGRDTNVETPTVLIYDESGEVRSHIIASAGESGTFFSVDAEENGDFVVNGKMSNTFTFDGMTRTVSDGGYHPYFLYYSNPVVGIEEQEPASSDFSVYPNPAEANSIFYIQRAADESVIAELYNTSGQKMLQQQISGQIAGISLNHLSPGMYLLKVEDTWQKVIVK